MQNDTNLSLGARIDAVLRPFTEDEARLGTRLSELEHAIRDLQEESEQARQDLAVVESAKVDALRAAAKEDPLLRVAFLGLTPPPALPPESASPEATSPGGMAVEAPADAAHDADHEGSLHHDEPRMQRNVEADLPRHRLLSVNG